MLARQPEKRDKPKPIIYLIGSLRNPQVPLTAATLRSEGFEVFDDWYAAGPNADDCWRDYEKSRGLPYPDALRSWAAKHVFEFDKAHLDRSDAAILLLPAGRSGHLELGYMAGQQKPTYVLFDQEPERWDVMYGFCTGVCFSIEDLIEQLKRTL
jgi:nucleoside 2-deoxyribosyltransferase